MPTRGSRPASRCCSQRNTCGTQGPQPPGSQDPAPCASAQRLGNLQTGPLSGVIPGVRPLVLPPSQAPAFDSKPPTPISPQRSAPQTDRPIPPSSLGPWDSKARTQVRDLRDKDRAPARGHGDLREPLLPHLMGPLLLMKEILTPGTLEYGLNWRQGVYRGNQGNVRSLE